MGDFTDWRLRRRTCSSVSLTNSPNSATLAEAASRIAFRVRFGISLNCSSNARCSCRNPLTTYGPPMPRLMTTSLWASWSCQPISKSRRRMVKNVCSGGEYVPPGAPLPKSCDIFASCSFVSPHSPNKPLRRYGTKPAGTMSVAFIYGRSPAVVSRLVIPATVVGLVLAPVAQAGRYAVGRRYEVRSQSGDQLLNTDEPLVRNQIDGGDDLA